MSHLTNFIGEIWEKVRGAGKEIIKRFSDKVIQPMARHLNERSQRKRRPSAQQPVTEWKPESLTTDAIEEVEFTTEYLDTEYTTIRATPARNLRPTRRCQTNGNGAPKRKCTKRRKKNLRATTLPSTTFQTTTIRTTTLKRIKVVRRSHSNKNEPSLHRPPSPPPLREPAQTTFGTTAITSLAPRRCPNSKNDPSLPRCLPLKKLELRRPNFQPAGKRSLARRCRNNKNELLSGRCRHHRMKPLPRRMYTITDITTVIATTKKPCTSRRCRKNRNGSRLTTTPAPLSDVICRTCACADSYVYCNNMNIHEPFQLEDWNGLSNFTPVTVDLSQNPLSSITRIGKLPIQVLNLSNCYISNFEPASLSYLEDINTLDLSHNKISATDLMDLCGPLEEIAEARPFRQMLDLSLAHNAIYSLPVGMFTFMNNLSFLDLSGNPLAVIDTGTVTVLSMLGELKHLLMKDCELEVLPMGLFKNQKKLRWLDLSANRFMTVPAALQDLLKLSFLSLDRNPIVNIDEENSITRLSNLEELHLSHMSRLQNITAGALGGLLKLGVLRLNHNPRLSKLDPNFLVSTDGDPQWPTLRELHLNNNNLSTISADFLEYWDDLEAGDFSNNPYMCDCDNQWMVDVLTPLVQNFPQSQTVYQMVCNKPAHLRGISFGYMSNISKTLPCETKVNQKPGSLMMTLGTVTGIIAIIPVILFFIVMLWKRVKKRKKSVFHNIPKNLNDLL